MLEEEIVKKLLEKQYTVTTAESCTGGFLRLFCRFSIL